MNVITIFEMITVPLLLIKTAGKYQSISIVCQFSF